MSSFRSEVNRIFGSTLTSYDEAAIRTGLQNISHGAPRESVKGAIQGTLRGPLRREGLDPQASRHRACRSSSGRAARLLVPPPWLVGKTPGFVRPQRENTRGGHAVLSGAARFFLDLPAVLPVDSVESFFGRAGARISRGGGVHTRIFRLDAQRMVKVRLGRIMGCRGRSGDTGGQRVLNLWPGVRVTPGAPVFSTPCPGISPRPCGGSATGCRFCTL